MVEREMERTKEWRTMNVESKKRRESRWAGKRDEQMEVEKKGGSGKGGREGGREGGKGSEGGEIEMG